jgi:hypothetical protein
MGAVYLKYRQPYGVGMVGKAVFVGRIVGVDVGG